MKLKFRGNDLIVFLDKKEIDKINFNNRFELEKYFRTLFIKIKSIYSIDFKGSYNITIYVDKKIGIILEVCGEDTEYFEYDDDIIDMNLKKKDDEFIFKVDNIGSLSGKFDFYLHDNDIYVVPFNLNYIDIGILFENSTLIYGEERRKIMNDLSLIKLDKIW